MDVDIDKKRKREDSMKKNKAPEVVVNQQDPALRELPLCVKPLVEENSKEFLVKGDGPCFLRTTAAHLYGDEEEWAQLARDLNTHQAEYRETYTEKISADFPVTVQVGVNGETKVLQNSTEYFDWL